MIKMILTFLILFGVFFLGIKFLSSTPNSGKKELLKIAGYSIVCSLLTLAVLVLIVMFF
jgi:hypothetical protein